MAKTTTDGAGEYVSRPEDYAIKGPKYDPAVEVIIDECARDVWDTISLWRGMGIGPRACAFPADNWQQVARLMSAVWYDLRGLSSWTKGVGDQIASSPYRSGP